MSTMEDLSNMVAYAEQLRGELEAMDQVWKEKRARLMRLEEEDIPTLMDELKFKTLETATHKIEVKAEWTASIPKYKKADVVKYAEQLGCGALVSHSVGMEFRKGEEEFYERAVELLDKNQQRYWVSEDINTGSWKKAVKELIAAGQPIDLERACVRQVRKANIKRKD